MIRQAARCSTRLLVGFLGYEMKPTLASLIVNSALKLFVAGRSLVGDG
jgi:hypothetical protein